MGNTNALRLNVYFLCPFQCIEAFLVKYDVDFPKAGIQG